MGPLVRGSPYVSLMAPAPDNSASPPARSVLVVGTDDWGVEQVAESLGESGYRTLTCHPAGEPAFPCNALVEGRTCPLDIGFSVVVSVRARPSAQPAQGEMGVICGLRAGASLVTAGMAGHNPFVAIGARVVGPSERLADVVAEAAGCATPAH